MGTFSEGVLRTIERAYETPMNPDLRTKILLNGTWQLQPSNDETIPTRWNHSVTVPALVDIAEPRCDWKSFKYHYCRRTFKVSTEAELAYVVIEQAMFGTDVWLNGKRLGCDIACYTSQEYDCRSALKSGTNELIVRVGQRENLPAHSAVGKDQERTEWIPGIWGDVYLLCCGNPRVELVQVIPHIATSTAEVRVTVENLSEKEIAFSCNAFVCEKKSGKKGSEHLEAQSTIAPNGKDLYLQASD